MRYCVLHHAFHSITSSAATSSLSGTVRPSILAVWALMTSSNLVDRTTGKSAGFAPLEDATGINAHPTRGIRQACSVAHQPADFGKVTRRIYRGHRVAHRQIGQLNTPADKERVGADENGVG